MAPKKTDFDKVKEVYLKLFDMPAEKITCLDTKEDGPSLWMIGHPFYQDSLVGSGDKQIDFLSEDGRKQLREKAEKRFDYSITQEDALFRILLDIQKPYRFQFIYLCKPYLSKADFTFLWGRYLNESLEYINSGDIEKEALLECFKACDLKQLLAPEAYNAFKGLEDEITVYKGISSMEADDTDAVSSIDWTLNFYFAYWSVARYGTGGTVYKAKIKKEYALAFMNLYGAEDIIIDPEHLEDVKEYQEVPAFKEETHTSTTKKTKAPGWNKSKKKKK